MNERQSDFEWLQQFARAGNQSAFRDLVRRHIDLVFATALRKVGDAGGAEEISQNVFGALAKKAWQFAPDDSLPAWLHKTTLLESQAWQRGEMRRRQREQTAAELGTTMKTPDEAPAFHALVPLLDEALLSLREKDREALLLRYYESQSLKDVGAALGVSDDTAQKRVQTALEKLSHFFQRRGFKSATVAATVATLQHTASSASATTVSLVFNGALQMASPALVGLSAWLARFASLTKLQTAAVCLAIAAAPVVWQWRQLAQEQENKARTSEQLALAQAEAAELEAAVQTLRESAAQLERGLADSEAQASRQAAARAKFDTWKKSLRRRLLADKTEWLDDSPFVRIPKAVLQDLNIGVPISPPGIVSQPTRELLGLTPDERERLESALQKHFAVMDDLAAAQVYETNQLQHLHVPEDALASKRMVLPALGDAAKSASDELKAVLTGTLGSERWQLVEPTWETRGTPSVRKTLNLDAASKSQEMAMWISEVGGKLTATYQWATEGTMQGSPGTALEMFLPGATLPDGTTFEEPPKNYLSIGDLPQSLNQSILDWLQQQAVTRLATKGNP